MGNINDNKLLERAEIVKALRCCGNTDTKRPDCEHCPLMGNMCVKRMLEGAATLLERDTESNDPLTLEELRGMDGEPVWVQDASLPQDGQWAIVSSVDIFDGEQTLYCKGDNAYRDYGKTWLAYRRKPDGGGE